MAEISFSFDCASECRCVHSELVNQTDGALNVKCYGLHIWHTCFQGQSEYDPLKFMEKGHGQGHVTPKILKITWQRYAFLWAPSCLGFCDVFGCHCVYFFRINQVIGWECWEYHLWNCVYFCVEWDAVPAFHCRCCYLKHFVLFILILFMQWWGGHLNYRKSRLHQRWLVYLEPLTFVERFTELDGCMLTTLVEWWYNKYVSYFTYLLYQARWTQVRCLSTWRPGHWKTSTPRSPSLSWCATSVIRHCLNITEPLSRRSRSSSRV